MPHETNLSSPVSPLRRFNIVKSKTIIPKKKSINVDLFCFRDPGNPQCMEKGLMVAMGFPQLRGYSGRKILDEMTVVCGTNSPLYDKVEKKNSN
ncbi:hypothetical protein TNCV_1955401 [Trichonephila clavipes]|nr:hypothetical protein TNCV_1955401 [Trichonephila clavipes]